MKVGQRRTDAAGVTEWQGKSETLLLRQVGSDSPNRFATSSPNCQSRRAFELY